MKLINIPFSFSSLIPNNTFAKLFINKNQLFNLSTYNYIHSYEPPFHEKNNKYFYSNKKENFDYINLLYEETQILDICDINNSYKITINFFINNYEINEKIISINDSCSYEINLSTKNNKYSYEVNNYKDKLDLENNLPLIILNIYKEFENNISLLI